MASMLPAAIFTPIGLPSVFSRSQSTSPGLPGASAARLSGTRRAPIDGATEDWGDAIPVTWTTDGKKTVVSTYWNRRRFALLVVDHVLGSGMSSRLFREIREQRGLAYAVYSFRMPYADSGAYGIYVGTTPHQTADVLTLVRGELDMVVREGITAEGGRPKRSLKRREKW